MQLPEDIRWHFIGHLQSNKVKYIAPFVYLIHGVDSLKLREEINKQGKKHNRIINCLLQVYIANEETKFGLSFDECESIFNQQLGNLVYSDVNANGTFDAGDTPLAGATVQLYTSNGTEINVGPDGILGTADDAAGGVITGAGGTYQFGGLPQGDYIVRVTYLR